MAGSRIRSIAFPFRKGTLAFPKQSENAEAIRGSVIQIITTNKGERVMRPDFGCNAFSFVFEPNSEDFRGDVEREVRRSLARWERRIRVDSVTVAPENNVTEPGQIIISISYTIVTTGEVDSTTIAGGV